QEALLWHSLDHPNVLPFIGIDSEMLSRNRVCLVSPWMDNGNLRAYVTKNSLSNSDCDGLLLDVAAGLEYLHENGIVHGHLRGANILISDDWHACICDFGLANFADPLIDSNSSIVVDRVGSVPWMAPELLRSSHDDVYSYPTFASDVYAFGCVCHQEKSI
ncbi:kinase-like protein, partial [Neolentinus lepideus HHB14362 ss-1]